MKNTTMVNIGIIMATTFIFSKSYNTSFKISIPYSTAHILLGAQNVSGKNFVPTLGLSYFGVSSKSKFTEYGQTDESDIAVRFFAK